jgi:uncharacterized protein (TIGR04255 family)
MLFPESERVLYEKNPLAEVVCQFRYPTILRIREKQLADFQDIIRNDYPVYTEQEPSIGVSPQLPKELASLLEQVNIHFPSGLVVHRFSTKDLKRFISLRSDFVALAETNYEKWEFFIEEVIRTESALREIYTPAFYSRIGLRYRDIISRHDLGLDDVEWQDLLKPYFIAELGNEAVSEAITQIHTRVNMEIRDIPGGQIVLNHGLITPNGSAEECYLIDADFFVERKEGVDEYFEILAKFNRMAGRLFRWAITDKLHRAMEPRAI